VPERDETEHLELTLGQLTARPADVSRGDRAQQGRTQAGVDILVAGCHLPYRQHQLDLGGILDGHGGPTQ
jgi:hypothetical protein